jgi:hypothetical protein
MKEKGDHLKRSNREAEHKGPPDSDAHIDDLDVGIEAEPWLDNPIRGAEELPRFSRARQLLQR